MENESPEPNAPSKEQDFKPSYMVSQCIKRIEKLVAETIPRATVEGVGEGPEGRVDLLARVDGVPVARSFVSRAECERAFAHDPDHCSPIDPVAHCWIQVLKVRMQDAKSWIRMSSKVKKL